MEKKKDVREKGDRVLALVIVIPLHSVNRLFQFSTVLALLIRINDFIFRRFAQLVGCDFSSLKECAKRKTFQEIVDAQAKIYPQEGALSFGPVLDGYFLSGTEMNIKQILLSPAKRREILALTRKKNEGCIVNLQSVKLTNPDGYDLFFRPKAVQI